MDLKETSAAMRIQSNRHTQYPLFIIQEKQEVVKAEGCGGSMKYWSNDGEHEMTAEQYEKVEKFQDNWEEEDQEELDELLEELGFEALSDIELSEFRAIEYDEEWVNCDNAGFFFTEQAADLHIIQNRHHYNEPRTYVISAWRNYEIQETMQMILKLTGEEIPSCYR